MLKKLENVNVYCNDLIKIINDQYKTEKVTKINILNLYNV